MQQGRNDGETGNQLKRELSPGLCDDLEGWDGGGGRGSRGRGICLSMANSRCCIAGTNTTLQSSYAPV